MTRRILIADPSTLTQASRGAALRHCVAPAPELATVGDGVDLLYHLAERGPFDLVVTSVTLAGPTGAQVLAMTRTAGLATPFLIVSHLVDARLRALVKRSQPAELCDDPLDVPAIMAAARRLLAIETPVPETLAWQSAVAQWRPGRASG